MNYNDLANAIAEANDTYTKAGAKQAVDAVFNSISEALTNGEEVNIPGFGKFKVNQRDERQGRNPATGESITIAASKAVKFSAAKALKDAL